MLEGSADRHDIERISTGLDDILGGGLPRGHLDLIEGDSGTGKTTLGLPFALDGTRRGTPFLTGREWEQ